MRSLLAILIALSLVTPANAALTDGLVSWWGMETNGGTELDEHGSSDLTESDASVPAVAGKVANARDFETADTNYLLVADGSIAFPTTAATFSMWLNVETFAATGILVKRATNQNTIIIRPSTTGNIQIYVASSLTDSANHCITPNNVLAAGTWGHVVIVFDGAQATNSTRLRIWVDGSEETLAYTGTIPASFTDSTADLHVGARGETPSYYDGMIDELAIWNRAITTDEIAALYNSGNGVSYADIAGSSPVAKILLLFSDARLRKQSKHFNTYGVYALTP